MLPSTGGGVCTATGLTRSGRRFARSLQAPKKGAAKAPSLDPNIRHLQDDLASRLGTRVSIQHTAKGKGKLVLSYNSLDELDGILNHIK